MKKTKNDVGKKKLLLKRIRRESEQVRRKARSTKLPLQSRLRRKPMLE